VPGRVRLASHATPRRFLLDVRATGQAGSEPRLLLLDPYPNPFVESQGFRFLLGAPAYLEVELFDVRGRRVARLTRDAAAPGEHVLEWDGRDTQGQAVKLR
jgi:hypothetical protein